MSKQETPSAFQITPMRGREVESLNFLFGLIGEAKRGEKSLGARLQSIGRLSQYKRIVTELDKILRELLETIPADKVARLRFGLDHQAVRIVTRNDPAVTDMIWAPADSIYGILNDVCYGECMFCEGSPQDMHKCRMRGYLKDLGLAQAESGSLCVGKELADKREEQGDDDE